MPLRRSAYQHHIALFGQDYKVAAGKQQLAVTIPAALPLQLPGLRVDARKYRFIETINIALI